MLLLPSLRLWPSRFLLRLQVLRLVQRTPVTQAVGGLLGVLVGVVWAWQSGRAEDYFAMGLWTNAAYSLASKMTQSFSLYGMCVAMRGVEDLMSESVSGHFSFDCEAFA